MSFVSGTQSEHPLGRRHPSLRTQYYKQTLSAIELYFWHSVQASSRHKTSIPSNTISQSLLAFEVLIWHSSDQKVKGKSIIPPQFNTRAVISWDCVEVMYTSGRIKALQHHNSICVLSFPEIVSKSMRAFEGFRVHRSGCRWIYQCTHQAECKQQCTQRLLNVCSTSIQRLLNVYQSTRCIFNIYSTSS